MDGLPLSLLQEDGGTGDQRERLGTGSVGIQEYSREVTWKTALHIVGVMCMR